MTWKETVGLWYLYNTGGALQFTTKKACQMFANLCMPHAMALRSILYVMEEKPAQEESKQKERVIEMDILSKRRGKRCQVHFVRNFLYTNLPCIKIQ